MVALTLEETNRFEGFSLDDWCIWIEALISHGEIEPKIEIGEDELQHVLARIYDNLRSEQARNLFSQAVAILFQITPPHERKSEQLYYLTNVISYIRPLQARATLRRLLFGEVLIDVTYGRQDLHTMLLNANCKYDVDDDLVDYIKRSAARIDDFTYLLVCFRALATRGAKEAVSFLDLLIPHLTSGVHAQQFSAQVSEFIRKFGYRQVSKWYALCYESFSSSYAEQWEAFEDILKQCLKVEEELDPRFSKNPYAMIVLMQLIAGEKILQPNKILSLVRLCSEADIEKTLAVSSLVNIWNKTRRMDLDSAWDVVSSSGYESIVRDSTICWIKNKYDEAFFNRREEQDVFEILEGVKLKIHPELFEKWVQQSGELIRKILLSKLMFIASTGLGTKPR